MTHRSSASLAAGFGAVLIGSVWTRPVSSQGTTPSRTKIVLLGTGTPEQTRTRSGPATAIIVDDTPYLVDFGPGVVRRAAGAVGKGVSALRPANIRVVLTTHLHADHTAGYPDLLITSWVAGRAVPLEVHGPRGIRAMTDAMLTAYHVDVDDRLKARGQASVNLVNAHEIVAGVVYKDAKVTVTAFPGEARRPGSVRVSLRHARSLHRHLGRHESGRARPRHPLVGDNGRLVAPARGHR